MKNIQLQFVTAPGSFLSHILDLIDVFGFYVVLHSVTLQVTHSEVFYDPSHITTYYTTIFHNLRQELAHCWGKDNGKLFGDVSTPLHSSLSLFFFNVTVLELQDLLLQKPEGRYFISRLTMKTAQLTEISVSNNPHNSQLNPLWIEKGRKPQLIILFKI